MNNIISENHAYECEYNNMSLVEKDKLLSILVNTDRTQTGLGYLEALNAYKILINPISTCLANFIESYYNKIIEADPRAEAMRDVFCQRICDMIIDEAWKKIKEDLYIDYI